MSRIGVIIGRFQIPNPHKGHKYLFNHAKQQSDEVIVLVGVAPVPLTNKNPLPYGLRSPAIQASFSGAIVLPVHDHDDDYTWSDEVDRVISQYSTSDDEVKIYHSRDSFVDSYHGKYDTEYIRGTEEDMSSSQIRANIANPKHAIIYGRSAAFKNGLIYAVENKFPVAYPTVDIAVLKYVTGKYNKDLGGNETDYHILLGRKHNGKLWRLPGGFVDPSDKSLENAAYRELHEEVPGIQHHEITYLGSHKIDDWRYRGTKDGIITSLFQTYIMGGNVTAGDDLAEVKWFDLSKLEPMDLEPCHHPLLQMTIKNIKVKR